jgi:hypothetical protein
VKIVVNVMNTVDVTRKVQVVTSNQASVVELVVVVLKTNNKK